MMKRSQLAKSFFEQPNAIGMIGAGCPSRELDHADLSDLAGPSTVRRQRQIAARPADANHAAQRFSALWCWSRARHPTEPRK